MDSITDRRRRLWLERGEALRRALRIVSDRVAATAAACERAMQRPHRTTKRGATRLPT